MPITSAQPALAAQVESARAAGADMVELRVDLIGDAAGVERYLQGPRTLPIILTARPKSEGGHGALGEIERLQLIERLGRLRPAFIDIEQAAWRESADVRRVVGRLCGEAGHNRLIISHHDFETTPQQLDAIFDDLANGPADIIKAVFTAHDATDSLRVLEQLHRLGSHRNVIALAMGEAGLASRVLARKLGGFLTFASLSAENQSAAGQPTIEVLRQRYRWDAIQPATRVYGVVGWPVAHSRSPHVHNAAMQAGGADGVYLPLPVKPNDEAFVEFMDCVARSCWLDIAGLSITIPHKQHALRWLRLHDGAIDPLARRIGAVNTLTRSAGGNWRGDNTDATGTLAALGISTRGVSQSGRRVAILGAGGVARAVAFALQEAGCDVTIYNRTLTRGESLAQELRCHVKNWSRRTDGAADLLVNCTPLGMWPDVDASPVPQDALRPHQTVFDTIYTPATTRLLRAAATRGCRTVSGAEMFISQAAEQYQIWHGHAANRTVMVAALEASNTI